MFHDFKYPAILAASNRAAWQIDEVIRPGAEFDFTRPFMPESLAQTSGLDMLSDAEKLTLNHIRAHDYLSIFGLVEEFILPFLMDHIRPSLPDADDVRVRAMMQFAAEEAKHIQLFKRFHETFTKGFGGQCEVIGPPDAVAKVVLAHDPMSVALTILMIEWMTQIHYVGSVRGDGGLEPLFVSLLRCHWMEEAQHAKLDTLMVQDLAKGMSQQQFKKAVDGFLEIGMFLDTNLKQQAKFNLDALERSMRRRLPEQERNQLMEQQRRALRWTYLGSGLRHEKFRATIGAISPAQLLRIDSIAPSFC
ncbi:MAG TPA: diiron oxygenase [Sphingomicrobium sp.]|nr:diiron oxygenase [Sphingomicrobium sp.]